MCVVGGPTGPVMWTPRNAPSVCGPQDVGQGLAVRACLSLLSCLAKHKQCWNCVTATL